MISFVIPAFNEHDIIADTILRLRNGAENIPNEVVLSDDGSTDDTASIASRYADVVVRYKGETPKTIGAARNRGARVARFPILIFVDSDVRIRDPRVFFQRVVAHFESNPEFVALAVSIRVYPETETWADRVIFTMSDLYFRAAHLFGFALAQKCMIVRTEAFRRVGGFNESLVSAEDIDLFLRLSKIGQTAFDASMRAYFSGRRAHAIGWPSLLWQWWRDSIWLFLFNRSYSTRWNRLDQTGSSRQR